MAEDSVQEDPGAGEGQGEAVVGRKPHTPRHHIKTILAAAAILLFVGGLLHFVLPPMGKLGLAGPVSEHMLLLGTTSHLYRDDDDDLPENPGKSALDAQVSYYPYSKVLDRIQYEKYQNQ